MTCIEVIPNFETLLWTICIDGHEIARSKDSIDCDVWLLHLKKMYREDRVITNNHASERRALVEQMDHARKEKNKTDKAARESGQGES